jgi:energy-coupling factor transporter ATP-binding protein EcfA2
MTDPFLLQAQRDILHDLIQGAAERSQGEAEAERDFQSRKEAAEKEFEITYQAVIVQFASRKEAVETKYQNTCKKISDRFQAAQIPVEREYREARAKVLAQFKAEKEVIKSTLQDVRWTLATIFEGNKNEAEAQLKEVQGRVGAKISQIHTIREETKTLLQEWKQENPGANSPMAARMKKDRRPRNLQECLADAERQFYLLRRLILPRVLKGWPYVWLLILIWLLSLGILCVRQGFENWNWATAAIAGVVVTAAVFGIGLACRPLLAWIARFQVNRRYRPLHQTFLDAETSRDRALSLAETHFRALVSQYKRPHDKALRGAYKKFRRQRAECKQRRKDQLRQVLRQYRRGKARTQYRRDRRLQLAEKRYQQRLADNQNRYETNLRQAQEKERAHQQACRHDYETTHQALACLWQERLRRAHGMVRDICQEGDRLFPAWVGPSWLRWTPPTSIPPVIRFGEYQVDLEQISPGLSTNGQLASGMPAAFSLPACLAFPNRGSLLFKVQDEGRAQAVKTLQAVMLRILTALPPGKARFTIIDPVGLGQNFSAFMHLADYDEAMVGSRIWTEAPHVEQRLADLTDHMEIVIQKYLRNQFPTIEEYNVQAGEVAEPLRFLVIANFPVHFSAVAARRLLSIAASGPRCGVYTLISLDTQQSLPQAFNLTDLEQHSVNLLWRDGRFHWEDDSFGRFPLTLDSLPDADFVTRILLQVGQKAKEAKRVEVPFEFIVPARDQWWSADSRSGIHVPLGRAGATKRQNLKLGQGTAHHVLIAGKTGSGKSTLLHALITNLALHYSPEEVELYLVDFKEGVEFKPYATHALPHARLVAIESEREFGLSVLQRLDAELKHRGERFRAAGVQDVAAYRQTDSAPSMPRILLIVDEFQLFFAEDDRIAQEAALLLDRLVRQGRAFGIHVLLGSQTLGGAYSLARSTIGQMAVRIALQCNEADAHLILSDDNPAARLLSRPGEAIYNDANGLVQGNDFFQVVWISEERKEEYLQKIEELARKRAFAPPAPQIVFEGNAPAEVSKNHLLQEVLFGSSKLKARGAYAWLGEALAIKDPTAAVFRPQSGSNLLIVGQNEEAAQAVMATAMISLAAQQGTLPKGETEKPRDGETGTEAQRIADSPFSVSSFYVLDGTPADSPLAGAWAKLSQTVPDRVRNVDRRELSEVLAEIAREVERRQKTHEAEGPALFLFIYGLQRFRELRKLEDDYSFARRGEEQPPHPSKQLAAILREGPGVGVHTLAWCDNFTNVQRGLDRQGLREFEMRVLFQMSAADSSSLIDSPAAGKLGLFRAIYYSEEKGQPEKFRPYGLPDPAWLEEVKGRMTREFA